MIHPLEIEDRLVELIDTGGMGIETSTTRRATSRLVSLAIDSADVVVFLVDTGTGPSSTSTYKRLRRR
jgi:predicted GTPase